MKVGVSGDHPFDAFATTYVRTRSYQEVKNVSFLENFALTFLV